MATRLDSLQCPTSWNQIETQGKICVFDTFVWRHGLSALPASLWAKLAVGFDYGQPHLIELSYCEKGR